MSVTLFRLKPSPKNLKKKSWDNQDLADFYRAMDILEQAGLQTDTDCGLTDEGDPWFVFIRPETGDVIAHFAQVDGAFIAVSSLNQEVYKGDNIRAIVDQMLSNYPLLLPKDKRGGKLFLHPTAAITAFLAAAFILNLDGIKVKSISEVLSATGPNSVNGIEPATLRLDSSSRSEAFKTMISDLNVSNYNVAILGAALIAHELTQTDFPTMEEVTKSDELTDQLYEGLKAEDTALDHQISVLAQRENKTSSGKDLVRAEKISLSDAKVNKSDVENFIDKTDESNIENQAVASLLGSGSTPEHDNVLADNFHDVLIGSGFGIVPGQQQQLPDVALEHKNSHTISLRFDEVAQTSDPSARVETFLESFQGMFQINHLSDDYKQFLSLNDLGVTVGEAGELKLISIKNLSIDGGMSGVGDNLVASGDLSNSLVFSASDDIIESEGLLEIEHTEPSIHPVDSSAPSATAPILGHSPKETGGRLALTDAIDVVFYKGGDVQISGFELGTDLLWFFLSENELSSAQNNVNVNGDLVLDFGSLGTLTFLEIVTDHSSDLLV